MLIYVESMGISETLFSTSLQSTQVVKLSVKYVELTGFSEPGELCAAVVL